MRTRWCFGLVLVGVSAIPGPRAAADPQGKVVEETWDAAYLQGGKAGFVRTTVRQVQAEDQKLFRTTMELNLTVKRFNQSANLRMETGTDETEDGRVTAVVMRQYLGKEQQLVVRGTVQGDRIRIRVDGRTQFQQTGPWNDQAVGLYRQSRLFAERKVKPGDRFSYVSYEPTVTSLITTRVSVKDYEEVEFVGRKRRLLKVEAVSDKIGGVQLPPLTLWLDKDRVPVRSQVDMPGLGTLVLYRITRSAALAPAGQAAQVAPDLGFDQLIRLNRRIPQPYDTERAVYRITVKADDDPATTFARDARQQITNVKGNTFELHVQALREPRRVEAPKRAGAEYLQSCYFINSDDSRVRELARRAVGTETDPWAKAKRIEQWVYRHMENKNFTENFATADHVARTLEGDCTEHSMLAAAMCRAAGVPSRCAIGLVYVEQARGPAFGFHMWTEVWVRGQWMPIDATFGRDFVGATHLKILDHSWHDTQTLTPLLPLVRVLGKVSIEVLAVNGDD
jgi:transglutaminase-like putative cysteine protease